MMSDKIKTYNDALNFIYSLKTKKINARNSLEPFMKICAAFGNPQESCKAVHIAGTNGKGSSAAMTAETLKNWGYKTGKFISPFIERFEERISVNGENISESDLVKFTLDTKNILDAIIKDPNDYLGQFEFVTLLAFCYFKAQKCDFVVLETGIGGRLDPTNAISKPEASLITSIDYDHTEILGDTLEKITAEKCGIIKKHSLCVINPKNKSETIRQILNTAKEKECDAITADGAIEKKSTSLDGNVFTYRGKEYKTSLAGDYQIYNAAAVIELIYALMDRKSISFKDNAYEIINNSLQITYFPARFEIICNSPLVIFDGAHNKSGVEALNKVLCDIFHGKAINLYSGIVADKKPDEILKEFAAYPKNYEMRNFTAIPVNSPRALKPEEYAGIAQKYFPDAKYLDSLALLKDDILSNGEDEINIIFGSFFLAADVKTELRVYESLKWSAETTLLWHP